MDRDSDASVTTEQFKSDADSIPGHLLVTGRGVWPAAGVLEARAYAEAKLLQVS